MNKIYFEIIFKLRQSPLFPSIYKYIRHCASYALNFLRSPEKISNAFTLKYMFLAWTVNITAVAIILPVRLSARSLPLLIDIIAHSVIYTR
jgi:hypothetical protein